MSYPSAAMRTAVLINAISTGCLYGISAFGFELIQKVTGTLHIFHGAVFLVAGYGLFSLAVLLELPVTAAVPLALVVAILVGIASDLVLYRPLSGSAAASELAFVASLGAFVVTTSILVLFFGRQVNTISDSAEPAAPFAGVLVAPIQVLNSIAWLGVTLLGWIGLTFTSFGRLLRALQSNPELLRAFGLT